MVFAGVVNGAEIDSGSQAVLYDSQVYIQNQTTTGTKSESGKPTIVAPQFKGNLIGNAKTADSAHKADLATHAEHMQPINSLVEYDQSSDGSMVPPENVVVYEYVSETITLDEDADHHSYTGKIRTGYLANLTIKTDANKPCLNGSLSIYANFHFVHETKESDNGELWHIFDDDGTEGRSTESFITALKNIAGSHTTVGHSGLIVNMGNSTDLDFKIGFDIEEDSSQHTVCVHTYIVLSRVNRSDDNQSGLQMSLTRVGSCDAPSPTSIAASSIRDLTLFDLPQVALTELGDGMRAKPNTDYTAYRFRNISLGTSSTPTADAVWGGNGSIYFQYS